MTYTRAAGILVSIAGLGLVAFAVFYWLYPTVRPGSGLTGNAVIVVGMLVLVLGINLVAYRPRS